MHEAWYYKLFHSLSHISITLIIIIALFRSFKLRFEIRNLFCILQHKYHTKIDDLIEKTLVSMKSGLVAKLTSVLKSVLEKLGRYDEGTVFGSILSSLVCYITFMISKIWRNKYFCLLQNKNNLTGTGTDLGKSYMGFCRGNMDQIEKKIKDDLWVLSTMEVRLFKKL